MKKKIIVITGDPNSINSEIIYKCWKRTNKSTKKEIYFISNKNLLQKQFKALGYSTDLIGVKNINEKENDDCFKILDIDLKFKKTFNVNYKDASKYIIKCLNYGHNVCKSNHLMIS